MARSQVAALGECVNRPGWVNSKIEGRGLTTKKNDIFPTSLIPYGKLIGQPSGCRGTTGPNYKLQYNFKAESWSKITQVKNS